MFSRGISRGLVLLIVLLPALAMAAPIVGDINFNKVQPRPNLNETYINPSLVKVTIEYPLNDAIPIVQVFVNRLFGIYKVQYLKDGILYVWQEEENPRKQTFYRVEVRPDEAKRITDELKSYIK